ncbi:MAG: cytochrome c oxidase assembly protein [Ilumatobacter sp.]|nr:cytochrome c oxidase assembly protein [Ilumatobacter sp.]
MAPVTQASLDVDPWKFQWHPEVWVLVAFLTGAFVYMVRVIGPRAVPAGEPVVTRRNLYAFVGAMAMLWVASDWPLHDISEEYLYSAHMLQHMMLSYFLPPLALLATPPWLLRVLIGDGRLYRATAFLARPVVAGVLFNVVVMVTHIPLVVTASVESGPLHYSLHAAVVLLSLLMWMPVVGPIREWHLGPLGKCIYLFLQSVVPTVPAAWLTFADGAVYQSYDIPVRVFGWSVTVDQQLAGAIMKTGGSIFLWSIVVYIFFARFASGYGRSQDYRRDPVADRPLTTADVEREFASSHAPTDRRP